MFTDAELFDAMEAAHQQLLDTLIYGTGYMQVRWLDAVEAAELYPTKEVTPMIDTRSVAMFGSTLGAAHLPDAVKAARMQPICDLVAAGLMPVTLATQARQLPQCELVVQRLHTGEWFVQSLVDGYYTNAVPITEGQARTILTPAQFVAGHVVQTGLTQAQIDAALKSLQELNAVRFGGYDLTADVPARRYCHVDGHIWVETGTLSTGCKHCGAKAQWSRETASWVEQRA